MHPQNRTNNTNETDKYDNKLVKEKEWNM
jgi:hypothetical protein